MLQYSGIKKRGGIIIAKSKFHYFSIEELKLIKFQLVGQIQELQAKTRLIDNFIAQWGTNMTITMLKTEKEAVAREAAKMGLSMSAWVRMVLAEKINQK